ncbi:hypothetical protein llap_14254 [Limosa lapponica baueri]|uniref:Lysophospholipid acyltransferase 1 n=1 Tax=Limosa lapponica baueri TaxID=1758121 RepID=A0A2I0TNT1_LIMLA|nr:hypothetical protein llap_14254 [Limosa lapponica baueri]
MRWVQPSRFLYAVVVDHIMFKSHSGILMCVCASSTPSLSFMDPEEEACQLFALLAAFWFRIYLGPSHASSAVRHAFATLFGIYFAVFCFGWYSIHLFVLVMMNYGIMNMASIPNIHRYSFVVAMGYLTLCHISRIYIFHYGILTTDFSGTRPSLLEYLSYLLNFMSIIAGPCSNYKDYIAFIEGRHVHMKLLEVNWKQKGYDRLPDPSPTGAVMYKLCITLVSLILFLTLTKNFPMAYIIDNEFLDKTPFLSRLGYLYVVTQAAKPKYYFAWTLADAVNNAAGYGFSGVDEKGTFRWDLLSNLNIWNIEIRNNCRHYFLSSVPLKIAYDVVTWVVTQLAVCYTVAPFVMLAVEPTIKFYKSMYFHMHILSILVLLVLPIRPRAHSIRKPQNQATQNSVKSKDK